MRALGIDFGSKRIGVAIAVSEPFVATARKPLTPLGALKKDAAQIANIARAEEVEAIVIGIPVNDENSRMARICQTLAGHLRDLGMTVHEVDESLTSVEAESRLREVDMTAAARRKVRDGEAACLILERYFGQA